MIRTLFAETAPSFGPLQRKPVNSTEERTEAPILLAVFFDIKGAKVHNFQEEEIGEIDDLLIEPDTGQVKLAVLSVGGILGLGAKKVGVRWLAIQGVVKDGKIRYLLDASRERLENAPPAIGAAYDRLYPA